MTIQIVNNISAAYLRCEITYWQAVEAIRNTTGWSDKEAQEHLDNLADERNCDDPVNDDPNNDYIKGIENSGKILNVAGYWIIGVGKGTLFMLVPMVAIGLSVGFMKRVINLGSDIGGA